MSIDVSIVIVSWNTKQLLRNCLLSVVEKTHAPLTYEIIVVDNASADGSGDMVKEEFAFVRLIQNDINRGFAAANNQAMKTAKGRYVLLLNSDTLVLDAAVNKAVAFADAHRRAAVVGVRVLNQDMSLQPTCFMFPSIRNMVLSSTYLYKLLPRSRFFGRERMTWWDRDDVRQVDVVTGCFMLVRQEAIKQVGFFDERFFMYGEETDWCYRFKQANWQVTFTPAGQIIHFGGQSSNQVRTEMLIQIRLSILKFIKKHRSRPAYRIACLLVAGFFGLRLPVWLILSVAGNSKHTAIARYRAYAGGIARICRDFAPARRGVEI